MQTVDYVVVGGGVYGCGVAWELARTGKEVVLLEAATIASGASGGLGRREIRANARDSRELPLMRRAHERWPSFAALLAEWAMSGATPAIAQANKVVAP